MTELAALTKNYSGAELAGVVRSASAFAMHAKLDMSNLQKKIDTNIRVSMDDFRHALQEVHVAAAGGVSLTLLSPVCRSSRPLVSTRTILPPPDPLASFSTVPSSRRCTHAESTLWNKCAMLLQPRC